MIVFYLLTTFVFAPILFLNFINNILAIGNVIYTMHRCYTKQFGNMEWKKNVASEVTEEGKRVIS